MQFAISLERRAVVKKKKKKQLVGTLAVNWRVSK